MLPFSYIQLFAILFKSSLKNSGRRAMYSCPSHEKHTANAPLKSQPHPFGLVFLTGEEGGGFRIRKRCLSEAGVACLNSAAQLLRKLHTVYISLHEKRNSFKRNWYGFEYKDILLFRYCYLSSIIIILFFLPCVFIVESCGGGSGDKGPVRKKV